MTLLTTSLTSQVTTTNTVTSHRLCTPINGPNLNHSSKLTFIRPLGALCRKVVVLARSDPKSISALRLKMVISTSQRTITHLRLTFQDPQGARIASLETHSQASQKIASVKKLMSRKWDLNSQSVDSTDSHASAKKAPSWLTRLSSSEKTERLSSITTRLVKLKLSVQLEKSNAQRMLSEELRATLASAAMAPLTHSVTGNKAMS